MDLRSSTSLSPPSVPERHVLRQRLRELAPAPSEFEAFCQDHFPEISITFGSGQNRVEKENRLFEIADHHQIYRWIEFHRTALQAQGRHSAQSTGGLLPSIASRLLRSQLTIWLSLQVPLAFLLVATYDGAFNALSLLIALIDVAMIPVLLFGSMAIHRFRQQKIFNRATTNKYNIFNTKSIGILRSPLRLEHVFVDLRISQPDNPEHLNLNIVSSEQAAQNRPIWHFIANRRIGSPDGIIIKGTPGCGKSTLLQHIAITIANNREYRKKFAKSAILLPLRSLKESIHPHLSLIELILEYFAHQGAFKEITQDWLKEQIDDGHAIIMFDGLDEVGDVIRVREVSQWIEAQMLAYPKAFFIITSRPEGCRNAGMNRVTYLEIQPFSMEQVERFITNWYRMVELGERVLAPSASLLKQADARSMHLLQSIREFPALVALSVNPLLLTMVAIVHRFDGNLPQARVSLYQRIFALLLEHWDYGKGLDIARKAADKLAVLRPVATHMMYQGVQELSVDSVLGIIAPHLSASQTVLLEFLQSIQSSSGLLLEREAGVWSFAHLTFQEYLVATQWAIQAPSEDDLRELTNQARWHETLRLYAGLDDCLRVNQVLAVCLQEDSLLAMTLASECLYESKPEKVAKELFVALNERLFTALAGDDPERRQFAVEVLLSRRMRSLQPITRTIDLDSNFLSCAEYAYFCTEQGPDERRLLPDHYTEGTILWNMEPIYGVRAEDAQRFCNWLNQRLGGARRIRLPTAAEVHDFPGHAMTANPLEADIKPWCVDVDSQTGAPKFSHGRDKDGVLRSAALCPQNDDAEAQASALSKVLVNILSGIMFIKVNRLLREPSMSLRIEHKLMYLTEEYELSERTIKNYARSIHGQLVNIFNKHLLGTYITHVESKIGSELTEICFQVIRSIIMREYQDIRKIGAGPYNCISDCLSWLLQTNILNNDHIRSQMTTLLTVQPPIAGVGDTGSTLQLYDGGIPAHEAVIKRMSYGSEDYAANRARGNVLIAIEDHITTKLRELNSEIGPTPTFRTKDPQRRHLIINESLAALESKLHQFTKINDRVFTALFQWLLSMSKTYTASSTYRLRHCHMRWICDTMPIYDQLLSGPAAPDSQARDRLEALVRWMELTIARIDRQPGQIWEGIRIASSRG